MGFGVPPKQEQLLEEEKRCPAQKRVFSPKCPFSFGQLLFGLEWEGVDMVNPPTNDSGIQQSKSWGLSFYREL